MAPLACSSLTSLTWCLWIAERKFNGTQAVLEPRDDDDDVRFGINRLACSATSLSDFPTLTVT